MGINTGKLKRAKDLEDEIPSTTDDLSIKRLSSYDNLTGAQLQSRPVEALPTTQSHNTEELLTPRKEIISSKESLDDSFFEIKTSASHSMVAGINNEVWSCAGTNGLLHVWDAKTF